MILSKCVWLFLVILVVARTESAAAAVETHSDARYEATCQLSAAHQSGSSTYNIPCTVALFSHFNFRLRNAPFVYNSAITLCEAEAEVSRSDIDGRRDTAIAVDRGNCSFDQKASNAISMGYRALIVVDHSSAGSFPMGSAVPGYKSTIPVLLIESKVLSAANAHLLAYCDEDAERVKDNRASGSGTCREEGTDTRTEQGRITITMSYTLAPREDSDGLLDFSSWRTIIERTPYLSGVYVIAAMCIYVALYGVGSMYVGAINSSTTATCMDQSDMLGVYALTSASNTLEAKTNIPPCTSTNSSPSARTSSGVDNDASVWRMSASQTPDRKSIDNDKINVTPLKAGSAPITPSNGPH